MPTDAAGAGPARHALTLLGAGGHARVVLDAARAGRWQVVSVRDDRSALAGTQFDGVSVAVPAIPPRHDPDCGYHVAIGDNAARAGLLERLASAGALLCSVVHPSAVVSVLAHVDEGSFLAAGCIVAPGAVVGRGCIVNHAAVVDHDCRLGAACHVAPGAVLGGAVQVGARVLIGSGAVLLPGTVIEDDARIGAGAVVKGRVRAGTTVAGVPARPISSSSDGTK